MLFFFLWLVVFVFTTKTKTRAINFNFDDMMVAVVRAGLHNTRDRRRAEGRLIFKYKTLQPRGRNIDFNFIWANSPSARFKCCHIWIKWQFKNCKTDAVIIRILIDVSAMLPSSGYTRLNTVRHVRQTVLLQAKVPGDWCGRFRGRLFRGD